MLVLNCGSDNGIVLLLEDGRKIFVKVWKNKQKHVFLGVKAPANVQVWRSKIYKRIQAGEPLKRTATPGSDAPSAKPDRMG